MFDDAVLPEGNICQRLMGLWIGPLPYDKAFVGAKHHIMTVGRLDPIAAIKLFSLSAVRCWPGGQRLFCLPAR